MAIVRRVVGLLVIVSILSACAVRTPMTVTPAMDSGISPSSLPLDKLQQLASGGEPDAQYALGYKYYYGRGVTEDHTQAVQWIRKAASQGQPQAIRALALLNVRQYDLNASATTRIEKATTVKVTTTTKPSLKLPQLPIKSNDQEASYRQSLLHAPSRYYTLQLMSGSNKQAVLNFIRSHHLRNAYYYQIGDQRRHTSRYVLVQGLYKTHAAAQVALKHLPASLKRQSVFVCPLSKVQAQIKSSR